MREGPKKARPLPGLPRRDPTQTDLAASRRPARAAAPPGCRRARSYARRRASRRNPLRGRASPAACLSLSVRRLVRKEASGEQFKLGGARSKSFGKIGAIDQRAGVPAFRDDEGAQLSDRDGQAPDVFERQPAPTPGAKDRVDRANSKA